eukprot:9045831-Ditylum_brightwellii.AAC.2
MLEGISNNNAQLQAAKTTISNQYSCNFPRTTTFFSSKVSCLHGPTQVDTKQKKQHISAINSKHSSDGRVVGVVAVVTMVLMVDMGETGVGATCIIKGLT